MTVILVASSDENLTINWWNWRPIVALLVRSDVLPAGEREERCLANGCGGYLSAPETRRAADCVESVMRGMNHGDRLLLDGTIIGQPNGERPPYDIDEYTPPSIYAAQYRVLKEFTEFCRRAGGLQVV